MDPYQSAGDPNKDFEPGKIFVGGLSWETTKENLQAYFEKYGEISDCVIMIDAMTKRPRGFGFVTFKDPASVDAVVNATQPHMLDGKTIDPKRAARKGASSMGGGGGGGGDLASQQACAKKVFVGGIANGTTEDDVRNYFSQYGVITELDLKYDKITKRMRGFGFVTFDTEEAVGKLIAIHFHQLNGKTVEVKKAESRYASAQNSSQRVQQAYGGNVHHGRGGYGYSGMGGSYSGGYGGYGYGQQQQQHQQQQQYGGYSYGGYGNGQSGGYAQGSGYDYSAFSGQQPGGSGSEQPRSDSSYYYSQQQYQDSAGYGGNPRSNYGTGTENYGQQAAYHYDTSGYTADSQPSTGYGRGAQQQQRGGGAYHYPTH